MSVQKKIINHKLGLDCKAYFMMKLMAENGMREKFYTAYKLCFVPVYNDIFMGEVKKI